MGTPWLCILHFNLLQVVYLCSRPYLLQKQASLMRGAIYGWLSADGRIKMELENYTQKNGSSKYSYGFMISPSTSC